MSADAAGLPTPFEFEGVTYQVYPRSLQMELLFSTWAEAEAARVVRRHRATLGEEEAGRRFDAWQRDCGAHLYDWGERLAHAALCTAAGTAQILFLKMKRGEQDGGPPVDRELLDRVRKDRPKWDELVGLMMKQDFPQPQADPNAAGGEVPAP